VWALAVCLYKSVSGKFPFTGTSENNLYSKIKKGSVSIPDFFSSELTNLIHEMFNVNFEERLTVEQALKHSWFHDISIQDLSTRSISTN